MRRRGTRLVRQQTEEVNALRNLRYAHGHVFLIGFGEIGRMEALVTGDRSRLAGLRREGRVVA